MLESLKERNLAFLKPRFHKPGLELLLRKNVFSSESSDIVDDHLTSMNLNLAQANNPRKKKRTGGTQMKQHLARERKLMQTLMAVVIVRAVKLLLHHLTEKLSVDYFDFESELHSYCNDRH